MALGGHNMSLASSVRPNERPRRRLGTVDDVLAMLPLPRSTFYDHVRAGRLPGVVRVGRRLLFDLDELDRWLDAGGGSPE